MRRLAVLLLALAAWPPAASAADPEPLPDLEALYALEAPATDAPEAFAGEKRRAAMRLAALGFGSRSGLAHRGAAIAAMLDRFADRLDAVYRFDRLMLHAHGFTVLPPVLDETRRAFRLERGRERAASARRVLAIAEPARIVSAPPHWRDWLARGWESPPPPAGILFPRGADETAVWRRWLAEGWGHGTALADDIFASDLDRLNRTFEGVARWRRLHLAGMVSAPGLAGSSADVSGDRRRLRIGETGVRIDTPAGLVPDPRAWRVTAGGEPR